MIHFYTARRGHNYGYKTDREIDVRLLCTKEYVKLNRKWDEKNAITVATNVTCPECLEILIPIEELRLSKMRANLLVAKPAQGGTQ